MTSQNPTSDPRITVAIPFYRNTDYLLEAIASVLEQDVLPHEILICDDSETGEAGSIIAPGVRYIKNPARLGIGGNWNKCLAESASEFTVILHGDDKLQPGYIRRMLELADANPTATGIFCAASTMNEHGGPCFSLVDKVKPLLWPQGNKPVQIVSGERGLTALLRGDFIVCPSLCYRMEKLGRERFNETYGQVLDLDMFCRLLLSGHTLIGSRAQLITVRRHTQSHTRHMERMGGRFREEAACIRRYSAAAMEKGWPRAGRVGRGLWLTKAHYLVASALLLSRGHVRKAFKMMGEYGEVFP